MNNISNPFSFMIITIELMKWKSLIKCLEMKMKKMQEILDLKASDKVLESIKSSSNRL